MRKQLIIVCFNLDLGGFIVNEESLWHTGFDFSAFYLYLDSKLIGDVS